MNYTAINNLLKKITLPAMGCTEPAALAYAAALARDYITAEVKSINLVVDKKFYKNCRRVVIPKSSLKGLDYALALGLVAGKPEYKLEVFRDINADDIKKAEALVARGVIDIDVSEHETLYIDVAIITAHETARCCIEGSHDGVTYLGKIGAVINCSDHDGKMKPINQDSVSELEEPLDLQSIIVFSSQVPIEELSHLEEGCEMNYKAALFGMAEPEDHYFCLGLSGNTELNDRDLSDPNLINYAKRLTTAASDVRLSGKACSIMSIAGSGNLGITSTLPILAVSKQLGLGKEQTLRAVALSQLVTYYIKKKVGVLSSVCGCAVAGGVGAGAGMVLLLKGSERAIMDSITNMLGTVAGMLCDGAKESCALKVSIATGAAIESANLALKGISIPASDGFIGSDIEKTLDNFATLSNQGMKNLENVLIEIIKR